ncbi:tyrosine kinase [Tiger frog virus]|uniref:Tyrosine kinase n=1 Tax=Rana tigrina ranavirus TaxID=160691 RepID=A0A8A4YMD8_RTRV|nr:tyrosine kinase [Tiger frog virus]
MANFLRDVNCETVSEYDGPDASIPEGVWEGYVGHDHAALWRTWSYVYECCKKGTLVQFRGGKLVTFSMFDNPRFSNGAGIDAQKVLDLEDRARELQGYGLVNRRTDVMPVDRWTLNGPLLRYDKKVLEDVGGTGPNRTMVRAQLEALQDERDVPDCDFILNVRDYPLLRRDCTRPYPQVYGKGRRLPEPWARGGPHVPVVSMCSGPTYADIAVPTYECIAHAYTSSGRTLPAGGRFVKTPSADSLPAWKDRKALAVFRGSSTGAGTSTEDNQRLRALQISMSRPDLADVGITKWNLRPRKTERYDGYRIIEPWQFGRKSPYPAAAKPMTPEQIAGYKYVLCLWGHAPAFRLARDLSLGSVVLLPSRPPGQEGLDMWHSSVLKPWTHYIPVRGDLSDLEKRIEWCRDNDAECEKIAAAGMEASLNLLGWEGQLDRWMDVLRSVRLECCPGGYDMPPSPSLVSDSMCVRQMVSFPRYEDIPQPSLPMPVLPRCSGTLRGWGLAASLGWDLGDAAEVLNVKRSTAVLSKTVFNNLIYRTPHLRYTFGVAASDTESTAAVMLSEKLKGAVTMRSWLEDSRAWARGRNVASVLCQVSQALLEAQAAAGTVFGDLSLDTILVVPNPLPEYIYHDGTGGSFGLKLMPGDKWAVVTYGDYTRARIRVLKGDGRKGHLAVVGPQPVYTKLSERKWHDICCLVSCILRTARTSKHPAARALAAAVARAAGVKRPDLDAEALEATPYEAREEPLTQFGPAEFIKGLVREFKLEEGGWAWTEKNKNIEKVLRPWERGLPLYPVRLWLSGDRKEAMRACVSSVLKAAPPRPATAAGAHHTFQTYLRTVGADLDSFPEWAAAAAHLKRLWKSPGSLPAGSASLRAPSVPPPCHGPAWALPFGTRTPGEFPSWFDPSCLGDWTEALGQGAPLDIENGPAKAGSDPVAVHSAWETASQLSFEEDGWTESEPRPVRREAHVRAEERH